MKPCPHCDSPVPVGELYCKSCGMSIHKRGAPTSTAEREKEEKEAVSRVDLNALAAIGAAFVSAPLFSPSRCPGDGRRNSHVVDHHRNQSHRVDREVCLCLPSLPAGAARADGHVADRLPRCFLGRIAGGVVMRPGNPVSLLVGTGLAMVIPPSSACSASACRWCRRSSSASAYNSLRRDLHSDRHRGLGYYFCRLPGPRCAEDCLWRPPAARRPRSTCRTRRPPKRRMTRMTPRTAAASLWHCRLASCCQRIGSPRRLLNRKWLTIFGVISLEPFDELHS